MKFLFKTNYLAASIQLLLQAYYLYVFAISKFVFGKVANFRHSLGAFDGKGYYIHLVPSSYDLIIIAGLTWIVTFLLLVLIRKWEFKKIYNNVSIAIFMITVLAFWLDPFYVLANYDE